MSHIITEHHARVRLEDHRPAGTRFVIEFNTVLASENEGALQADEESPATLKV